MANIWISRRLNAAGRDAEPESCYHFVKAGTIWNRWRLFWLWGFLGQLFLFPGAFSAMGESFRFQWDPSPEADVAGYNLYWGPASRQYQANLLLGTEVCQGNSCAVELDLEQGRWYVAVTAINRLGMESDYSQELHVVSESPDPTLIYPDGSITWIMGCSYDILWKNFSDAKLTLKLLKDGVPVKKIAKRTANDGVFSWVVSKKLKPGEGYSVRVSGKQQSDFSEEEFRIVAPTVTSPAKGALLAKANPQSITWDPETFCGPHVDIWLLKGARQVLSIASSVPNTGRYEWEVPSELKPSSRYRVKVASTVQRRCAGYSQGYFSIE